MVVCVLEKRDFAEITLIKICIGNKFHFNLNVPKKGNITENTDRFLHCPSSHIRGTMLQSLQVTKRKTNSDMDI